MYIGEYGWHPWANTIAYYKFDWNLNDSSWNNRNLSIYSWSPTYWTETWWGRYIYFPNNCWTTYWEDTISYGGTTLSFWYKWNSGYNGKPIIEIWASGYNIYGRISGDVTFEYFTQRDWPFPSYSAWSNWHYYTIVRGSDNYSRVYVDWQSVAYWNWSWSWTRAVRFRFNQYGDTNASSNCNSWNLSEVILETVARTAQEVADYYNQTKWDYWL